MAFFTAVAAGKVAKATGGFLVANWKAFAVIAILAFAGWKYYSLDKERDVLEGANTILATKNVQLTADNKQLAEIADASREAAAEITRNAARLDGQFADLARKIARQDAANAARIAALRNRPAPKTDVESFDYLIRGAKDLRSNK